MIDIPITSFVQTPSVKSDEIHLMGGLRATTSESGNLILYPNAEGKSLKVLQVTDRKQYYRALRSFDLDIVGHEQHVSDNKISQSIWYHFEPAKHDLNVVDLWSGIANTARASSNTEAAEVASHIGFTLRLASLRLRDCSREYLWQNEYSIAQDSSAAGKDRHFTNIKSFDLDMALHSVLVEMCSARDYLAQFVSAQILRDSSWQDFTSV